MNRYSSVGGECLNGIHTVDSWIPIPDSYISSVGGDSDPRSYISSVGGDSDPRSYILFSMQSVHSAIQTN